MRKPWSFLGRGTPGFNGIRAWVRSPTRQDGGGRPGRCILPSTPAVFPDGVEDATCRQEHVSHRGNSAPDMAALRAYVQAVHDLN